MAKIMEQKAALAVHDVFFCPIVMRFLYLFVNTTKLYVRASVHLYVLQRILEVELTEPLGYAISCRPSNAVAKRSGSSKN